MSDGKKTLSGTSSPWYTFEAEEKEPAGRILHPHVHGRQEGIGLNGAARKRCEPKASRPDLLPPDSPYVCPIRKVGNVQGSIDGLAVNLTEDEMEIEKANPFDHGFPHTFLSGSLFEGVDADQRMADGPEDVALTTGAGQTIDWVARPVAIRPPKKG
ncbi:hypothetical protein HKX48_002139 [Thoreauomyces humboldtii]|nr:hypothetical protein HKX48_002139 [Thoreauomyces humboldtii]